MDSGYPNVIVLQHLKQALEDLLTDKDCLTVGVRNVWQWAWANHGLDEVLFRPFVAVDSQTDRFPVGAIRERWNSERLLEVDAEREVVEARYRDWTMESGRILLDAVIDMLPKATFRDPDPD